MKQLFTIKQGSKRKRKGDGEKRRKGDGMYLVLEAVANPSGVTATLKS